MSMMGSDAGQRGAILPMTLVFLGMATVLGVTSMRLGMDQERIAAHQRQSSLALMAAESGISEVLEWITGPDFDAGADLVRVREALSEAIGREPDGDAACWFIGPPESPGPACWHLEAVLLDPGSTRFRIRGWIPGSSAFWNLELGIGYPEEGEGGETLFWRIR